VIDLIVEGGRIVSGTGNPWYKGDIGVEKDRIIEIGELQDERADTVIDAKRNVVCPGFIDTHSHSDLMWLANPRCEAKVTQGITTEVLAQDGLSGAPVRREHIALVRRLVSGLLGDPDIEWDWTSLGEYLARFEKQGIAVNIASLVPHGNVRIWAMGMEKRAPSPSELSDMKQLVATSMKEGAMGLSTGLIYAPCTYADKQELVELCKVVSELDGYLAVHMRNEGDMVLESMKEVVEVGEQSGASIHIDHFKVSGRSNWGKAGKMLEFAEQARSRGLELTLEQYPYTAGSTMLWALLPPWSLEGGFEKTIERLKDPDMRARMKQEIRDGIPGWEDFVQESGWEGIFVSSLPSEKNKRFVGKNLREIAEALTKHPTDALFDLLIEEKGAVSMVLFIMSEEDVRTIMKHPLQMFCTDGLLPPGKPHPRVYGTYPRVLGKYVREERIIALEEAIRKMTSYPAERLRLRDRGIIKVGAWADLVIFNPDRIADRATYEDPSQYPEGIECVIVNGQVAVKKGEHTGIRAGKVLKRVQAVAN